MNSFNVIELKENGVTVYALVKLRIRDNYNYTTKFENLFIK
jgi:hypothetical protein